MNTEEVDKGKENSEPASEEVPSTREFSKSRIVFGLVVMGVFFAAALTAILTLSSLINPIGLDSDEEDDWF